MQPIFAVLGYPIGHSRSPEIHHSFASQQKLRMEYRRIEVPAGKLPEAVRRFVRNGGCGCNVTVPLKEEAAELSDVLGAAADLAGAANTLTFAGDGTIRGDNTDGLGLLRHLQGNLGASLEGAGVLIIGAGGAARGVLPSLLAAGAGPVTIANRTRNRALLLQRRFAPLGDIRVPPLSGIQHPPFDLVLNASSAGMAGEPPALAPTVAGGALCIDMAYGPSAEPFLAWARAGKARDVHDGWGMLVEQAAESFAIWHGRRPDTASLIGAS